MGQEYGMMPTDVMNRPAWDFWMNTRIRAAGKNWEAEQRQKAQQGGSAGAATEGEKQDLTQTQEQRAEQREAQGGQPSIQDQLAAMADDDPGRDPSGPGQGGR